jgi:hypothetical protein
MVNVNDAEAGVDGRLIGIGGWSEEVVEVEPRHQLGLVGKLLIEPYRKLVGVGDYLRRGCIRVQRRKGRSDC